MTDKNQSQMKQNPDDIIQIYFEKIFQAQSYSIFLMGNDQKQFAIYSDPSIGKIIQSHISSPTRTRPFTHDLISLTLKGLDAKILRIIITDFQDTVYFARLCIEQVQHDKKLIVEIDARPSDCITLAILNNSPIYCTRRVLENSIPFSEQ